MARFIAAGYGRYINVADVEQFYLEDGAWYAQMRDGGRRKLGEGEYPERLIALATGAVFPAAPDDVLHRFWLGEDNTLVHEKQRIEPASPRPTPVTAEGPRPCGWDREAITAIQLLSGGYDDIESRLYADEEAIRRDLEALQAEAAKAAE